MSNSWGKSYVDKYIHKWENKNTVGYVVFIHRNDLKINERFETLEKAQAFRDEALRLCEIKRIQKLRADLQINEYPYNLIEALEFNVVDVIEHFNENLNTIYNKGFITEREYLLLINTYQNLKTFDESAKIFDISKARTQQICAKALRKLKYHHDFFLKGKYSEPYVLAKEQFEANREKLICEVSEDIADLGLTIRSYNCLRRAGIYNISELINKHADNLFKIRNLGRKSLKEILNALNKRGYYIEGQENYGVYYDKK